MRCGVGTGTISKTEACTCLYSSNGVDYWRDFTGHELGISILSRSLTSPASRQKHQRGCAGLGRATAQGYLLVVLLANVRFPAGKMSVAGPRNPTCYDETRLHGVAISSHNPPSVAASHENCLLTWPCALNCCTFARCRQGRVVCRSIALLQAAGVIAPSSACV